MSVVTYTVLHLGGGILVMCSHTTSNPGLPVLLVEEEFGGWIS